MARLSDRNFPGGSDLRRLQRLSCYPGLLSGALDPAASGVLPSLILPSTLNSPEVHDRLSKRHFDVETRMECLALFNPLRIFDVLGKGFHAFGLVRLEVIPPSFH